MTIYNLFLGTTSITTLFYFCVPLVSLLSVFQGLTLPAHRLFFRAIVLLNSAVKVRGIGASEGKEKEEALTLLTSYQVLLCRPRDLFNGGACLQARG